MKYLISFFLVLFLSCNGDKDLTSFLRAADIPISSALEINTVHTDSGIVSSILNSPKMLNFSNANFPYFEFPTNIEVILFDDNNNQTKIIADYAISYSNSDLSVGARIYQESSTGDVPSPFIGQFGAGEDHAGLHPWLRQSSGTAHGPVGVQQHGLTSALNQQSALAVAADGHASAGVGGALQSKHQSEGGECGGAQDGHRQLSDGFGR